MTTFKGEGVGKTAVCMPMAYKLLCAVTELKTRLVRVLSGGTGESVGIPGKQVRRKMVLYKTFLFVKILNEISDCEKVLERLLYGVLKENACRVAFSARAKNTL